jgi:SAM-dependent methyltransferase
MTSAKSVCPLCASASHPTGDRCGDRPDIKVLKCSACGLRHLSSFAHVSTGHYGADAYFPDDTSAMWERESSWNIRRIARLERELPSARTRTLLDFGCGIGGFLRRAQGRFGAVMGFDLSTRMAESHRAAGLQCFSDVADVPKTVDTLVLFHVLEHVAEPWALLGRLIDGFPRVDRVVIEVPNGGEMLVDRFDLPAYRATHYSADHLHYFDQATLRAAAHRAGLRVLSETQTQRYTLGNTMGWLREGRGGGQSRWPMFGSAEFHDAYEKALADAGVADSLMIVCEPAKGVAR